MESRKTPRMYEGITISQQGDNMTDDADISKHPYIALSEETRDFIEQDEIMNPVKIMRKKIKEDVKKMWDWDMSDKGIKNMKFTSDQKPKIDIVDTKPKETCAKGLHEGDPKIAQLQADENSYIHEHLETLRMLTILTRPNSILEIGTGRGDSTLAFAEGLSVNGFGHLITLDVKPAHIAHDVILDEDLSTFVTFLTMSSNDYLKKLEGVMSIDMLFIDGSHTFKQVEMELHLLHHYIADEGFIILHDTNNFAHPGVWKAVQDFLIRGDIGGWKMFEYLNCNGLTILQHDIPDG